MSTSPSWFDQEKFSRLVKKVGPKNVPEPAPAPSSSQPSPEVSTPASARPAPSVGQPRLKTPASQPPPIVDPPPQPQGSEPIEPPPVDTSAASPRISLVSKPPSILSEHRTLPALPRRTTPLPGLKSLFQYPPSAGRAPASTEVHGAPAPVSPPPSLETRAEPKPELADEPEPELIPGPQDDFLKPKAKAQTLKPDTLKPEPLKPDTRHEPKSDSRHIDLPAPKNAPPVIESLLKEAPPLAREEAAPEPKAVVEKPHGVSEEELAGIWQKMALLNEELAQTIQERDHAVSDMNLLREQLRQADDMLAQSPGGISEEDLAAVVKERDDARAVLLALQSETLEPESSKTPDAISKTRELVFLAQERDQARKEYVELRRQFENLKRDQTPAILASPREESGKVRKELEQQLDGFRLKLEEKTREIATLKAAVAAAAAVPPPAPVKTADAGAEEKFKAEIAALKSEVATLKQQAQKAKDDASIAQRGLALSQKALQETRDTLREATEGSSLSRHNFDNLKNECAALQQQLAVLQGQNEQLARELAAAKSKTSGRLPG